MLNNLEEIVSFYWCPSASSKEITLSNKYLHFSFTEHKLNEQVILRGFKGKWQEAKFIDHSLVLDSVKQWVVCPSQANPKEWLCLSLSTGLSALL